MNETFKSSCQHCGSAVEFPRAQLAETGTCPSCGEQIVQGESLAYFVLIDGERSGPFTLDELAVKWMTNKVSSSTLFAQPGMSEWQPLETISIELKRCIKRAVEESAPPPVPPPSEPLSGVGVPVARPTEAPVIPAVLMVLGLAVTLYFLLVFETSINTGSGYRPMYVENIGRLNTRQNGVIVGCALMLLGGIFQVGHTLRGRDTLRPGA